MDKPETTMGNIQNTLSNTYEKATDSMSSMYNNASSSIAENYNKLSDTTSSAASNIYGPLNTFKDSVTETVNEFSSKSVGDASSEFLESNSLIARFSFVLIVVIVFMILLRLGIYLVGYFTQPNNNPYVVKGLLPGSNPARITQDPTNSSSVTILRSDNQKTGLEFTWCIWLNIANINTSQTGMYQHIFHKGDDNYDPTGIAKVNNGPGMYLSSSSNPTLYVVMNTVSTTNQNQTITIDNIPLKKWVHVMLRMQNNIMDVYVNGVVTQRITFADVPKQNYQDVYVCRNNGYSTGFSGNLSDLRYYDHALNIFEITNIVSAGPNLSTSSLSSATTTYGYTYLSSLWYTNKME
jgi:hypothetical protein